MLKMVASIRFIAAIHEKQQSPWQLIAAPQD
jgi:hypothetical protein